MEITFQDRDEFKREEIADNLVKILEADIDVSPIVIDGPWGSGKSEFAHKFINKLKTSDKDCKLLYIDSFKYDHIEDPLLMLITQVASILPEGEAKKEYMKKAIPMLKVMGKVVGKAAVGWLFKENAEKLGEEVSEALSEGSNSILDLGIEKVFNDFENIEKNIGLFKESLIKVASDTKLVIFIDELDRCRPLFALDLLEKVKHVFDVEGLEFVFVTNLMQLEAMVKKQYGNSIDAEKYLSKFFPTVVQMPTTHSRSTYEQERNAFRLFIDKAQACDELKKHFREENTIYLFFEEQFNYDQLSLRDAEKFFNNIKIFNALSEDNHRIGDQTHWMYVLMTLLGIYIYTFHKELRQKLLTTKLELEDIVQFFNVNIEDFKVEKGGRDLRYEMFAIWLLELKEEIVKTVLDDKEKHQHWSQRASDYYQGARSRLSRGKRLGTPINAIRKLQFVNVRG